MRALELFMLVTCFLRAVTEIVFNSGFWVHVCLKALLALQEPNGVQGSFQTCPQVTAQKPSHNKSIWNSWPPHIPSFLPDFSLLAEHPLQQRWSLHHGNRHKFGMASTGPFCSSIHREELHTNSPCAHLFWVGIKGDLAWMIVLLSHLECM